MWTKRTSNNLCEVLCTFVVVHLIYFNRLGLSISRRPLSTFFVFALARVRLPSRTYFRFLCSLQCFVFFSFFYRFVLLDLVDVVFCHRLYVQHPTIQKKDRQNCVAFFARLGCYFHRRRPATRPKKKTHGDVNMFAHFVFCGKRRISLVAALCESAMNEWIYTIRIKSGNRWQHEALRQRRMFDYFFVDFFGAKLRFMEPVSVEESKQCQVQPKIAEGGHCSLFMLIPLTQAAIIYQN